VHVCTCERECVGVYPKSGFFLLRLRQQASGHDPMRLNACMCERERESVCLGERQRMCICVVVFQSQDKWQTHTFCRSVCDPLN